MLMTAESLRDALDEQRKAVAADQNSALVHSGMAHILISYFSIAGAGPGRKPLAEVQPWIDRSFVLEPGNPDAWAAVIRVHRDLELDFDKAENACRQALSHQPAGTPIQLNCAMIDAVRGRHEQALATLESVVRMLPTREAVLMTYANALYVTRRNEELLAHCRQVRKQSPSLLEVLTLEAAALVALGRAQEAVNLLRAAPDLEVSDVLRSALAYALARAGQRKEAEEWLQRVESQRARVLLALGRREEALACLEAEWERRSTALWVTLTDPAVQELAGEPRFERIRKGMKL
jgi:tetratricopeptide (TPR) repeat protein